jgi:hypothetical protein
MRGTVGISLSAITTWRGILIHMTHATDTHVAARTAFASARSRSRLHRRHRRRHHHWCGTTSPSAMPSAPVFAIAAAALAATNCISLAARIERFEVMGTRTNSQIPSRLRAQCVRSRDAKSVLPIGGDHAAVSPGRPVTRPLCTSIVAVAALYASDKQPVEC